MRKGFTYSLLSIAAILVLAQSVLGQSEVTVGNDFGVGARSMGMGGAFIGVADDSTALHWNPAGLSQIKRVEFFGGLSFERQRTESEYFGESDSIFTSKTRPNSVIIVLPVPVYRGGLAFALGVNRHQGFDVSTRLSGFNNYSLEDDFEFGQLYIQEKTDEYGGIYSWDFGGAVDVAPGVSLGGVLRFFGGSYDYELDLDADDSRELDLELTGFSYRDTISSEYFGVEAKLGILARFAKVVNLGATIDFPLDFSVDEYWSQDSSYVYDDGENESYSDEGTFAYDIARPFRFGAGISAFPIPGAALAADITYTDWTQTEYSEPPSADIGNDDFIDDYRDTLQLRLGGEFSIPVVGIKLRAGYIIDPLPYDPEGVEIETDRQFITAGIGLVTSEILSMDLAYARGFWKESIDGGTVIKDRTTNRIYLSIGYRF